MANSFTYNYPDIGDIGEDLVVNWLISQGWKILHRQFHSRWGEIDIIAECHDSTGSCILAFVEVKTRSSGNWDNHGKDAITTKKQAKLWKTAAVFLGNYPEKADCFCRFDVALVNFQPIFKQRIKKNMEEDKYLVSVNTSEYTLKLREYIPAAFDCMGLA
ncbi:YraN family protein [Anabaena sp. FACHB-1237]|uniref:YraN family protein n=1 Tax=Anabaena sp. FACHB-1237 TaxID=2692769 RepID=UPI0016813C4C|nr:YraN family protein [Anabaena sp. FACHB-1237]MBD2138529.1 YraN family protein [Anabaena sp. FACHB-1237]